MKTNVTTDVQQTTFITTDAFLDHWQGQRRLTRKVINAFPEDKLFQYSVGGMRTFAQLAMEMIQMAEPGVTGLKTGIWNHYEDKNPPKTKEELLRIWDAVTEHINTVWSEVAPKRFMETDVAFGQYENKNYATVLYFIDNEIHHRGQGYVYLRTLGIEPPAFWDRA